VIRAFPEAHFGGRVIDLVILGDVAEPFTVLPVDKVHLDEVPTAQRGLQEVRLPGELVGVEETDGGFGLRPPLEIGVGDAARIPISLSLPSNFVSCLPTFLFTFILGISLTFGLLSV